MKRRTVLGGTLPRRTVLRGALFGSAVAVGLPLLSPMLNNNGTALAQGGALPRRLGVFFFGNGRGQVAERWTPALTGPLWELSPQLQPLANVKEYLNVVSNSQVLVQSLREHHRGAVAMLSGAEYIAHDPGNAGYGSTFSTQSIDQLAADAAAGQTPFRSLEVRISDKIARGEGTAVAELSHNGPHNFNPSESNPAVIYERLFAAQSSQDSTRTHLLGKLRTSVLDAVRQDISDLHRRVGYADRARLDQHFENIRGLDRRIDRLANALACRQTPIPQDFPADGAREPLEERTRAMAELISVALSCDLMRSFTFQYTGSVGSTVFWQAGSTEGHHSLSHAGSAAQDEIDRATVVAMEHFAILLEALRSSPEGDGNLLDSSAILCTSDCSNGQTHSVEDMPIVVAGRGSGALKYPGVHYRADGNNTSEVLLSLLRATGLKLATFGSGGGFVQKGASEIEA
ncbi:MAG: hypothetical protein RJA70_3227 [Pseudomonadota bacterium]|jgi:hypothetical protein